MNKNGHILCFRFKNWKCELSLDILFSKPFQKVHNSKTTFDTSNLVSNIQNTMGFQFLNGSVGMNSFLHM
jgi:hypothetical protein